MITEKHYQPMETKQSIQNANLAVDSLEKHALDRSKIALVWENDAGTAKTFSFFDIDRFANKIANILTNFGVTKNDRVFTMMSRIPALYATIPAVLKMGAAIGILFPDFGAEAIRQRLEDAGAKIIITDERNAAKIRKIFEKLPLLEKVLVTGDWKTEADFYSFEELLKNTSSEYKSVSVSADESCFLIYTSGTTGLPKGVVHRHAIAERLKETALSVLNLKKDDFYWCAADPGWVTGLCYGIFAPWLHGFPILVYDGEFDSARWLDLLGKYQVTCFYTTLTMLRLLRNELGIINEEAGFLPEKDIFGRRAFKSGSN